VSSSLCWSIHDAHVLAGYRRLLRDNDDSLIDMRLDRRIDIWTATLVDGPRRGCINEFRVRYLDLERSAQQCIN
jgi:hypothetical protein